MEIIDTARIRLSELYKDSVDFVKYTYNSASEYFSMASPLGQLLQVLNNIGRMILYYIEDSITELNILTASRDKNIKGLVALTGHNPSRGMASRGTIKLRFNGTNIDLYGNTVVIPNYAQITSLINNLTYTIILPGEEARIDLTSINNFLNVNIVQGSLEYQQVTGTGDPMLSFNIQSKKGTIIDNFFVNIYVDGKLWSIKESILDMSYLEESVMVKTGVSGGIDVFFGNGYQGKVPKMGSTILIEYLTTEGQGGNLLGQEINEVTAWKFKTSGYGLNSEEIDLNKILNISIEKDIIFGTNEEPIYMSRLLAPKMSKSFVLANADNYIYFLRRLNLFTVIDAIPGFRTFEDSFALNKYNFYKTSSENKSEEYRKLISTVGKDSDVAIEKYNELKEVDRLVIFWQNKINEQKQDDNTVYLFLVPDVNKRISSNENYYTCNLNSFILSDNEKLGILNMIEESGQRILTIDNAILDLKYPKFVLNISLVIFEGYELNTISEDIISKTSEYFLQNTRRDRIPVSDLIRIIEGVEGVDSVSVSFDAAKENLDIYGNHYGLDDYGDVILERYIEDAFGNKVPVKDIYPIFRGGWESYKELYYEDSLTKEKLSNVNIKLRGITPIDLNSLNNKTIVENI